MSMPVMIVTGGSRGIGRATSLLAAKRGWAVVVNYASNKDAAEAVVSTIEAAGGRAFAIRADIGRESEIVSLFEDAGGFGRLGALVNNAGIVDRASPVAEMSAERLERMFRINITGPLLCAREAVRRMSTARGGNGGIIVNISSVAARLGAGGQYVDYAAAKGAIESLTVGLAREVVEEGIRVCGVRPGTIDTEIHASGGQPGRVAQLAPSFPMKRAGTVDEVAEAVIWLASGAASYSTGAILDVSGGRSI